MEGEKLIWRVGGMLASPDKALIVFTIALFAGLIGTRFVGHPVFGLIGLVAVLAATTEIWWGTRFELNAEMAKATTGISTTSIEWIAVKRVIENEKEITLSPLESETRLAPFRGVTLRFGTVGKEAILAKIREFREAGTSDG